MIESLVTITSFNGAVTFSLRKWGKKACPQHHIKVLQWGRNFFVTEIAVIACFLSTFSALQWGRNFFVTEMSDGFACQSFSILGFNGAVTFSLRK